jgi:two-component system phosphate regulon response regulator OmpR
MADEAHILVVEDNAPLRERLGRYLSTEGFRVTLAADAGEARTVRRRSPKSRRKR